MIVKRTDLSPRQNYTWIDARDITRDDVKTLSDEYSISSEVLADIMDQDEQARIEKEDEYTVIICRIPSDNDDEEDPLIKTCIPLKIRSCPVDYKEGLVISILGRTALVFIRLLKYINRQKDLVEEQLHKSVMNYELIQLLQIQKSLVYFTTSLTGNEMLLEKLGKTPFFRLNNEEEEEFLEDAITDNKQAIQMANIYSDILTGTMDAFASVIGNNNNLIIKRLTVISIALMFPTFITGFFGMNVPIPGMDSPFAWIFLIFICLAVALIGAWVISDRRNKQIIKANSRKNKKKSASERKYLMRKKAQLDKED